MNKIIVLLLIFLSHVEINAQENKSFLFTKIIVEQQISPQEVKNINTEISKLGHFQVSRMDRNTSLYVAIYESSTSNLEEKVKQWFENHGYTIKCYFTDSYEDGVTKNLTKINCQ